MTLSIDCRTELEALGGRFVPDPEGDYWLFEVGGFLVEYEPFEAAYSGGLTIGADASVSDKGLSAITERILAADSTERPAVLWWQDRHDVVAGDSPCAALRRLTIDLLGRVSRIDRALQIVELAATCPDRPSMRQVLHLAALAYQGDFPRLNEYVERFERGKRLNFVPMITKDMVRRAFDIAVEMGTA